MVSIHITIASGKLGEVIIDTEERAVDANRNEMFVSEMIRESVSSSIARVKRTTLESIKPEDEKWVQDIIDMLDSGITIPTSECKVATNE